MQCLGDVLISSVSGNLNSSAVQYLDSVNTGNSEYVMFRSGDYTTVLAIGDLSSGGNVISGSNVDLVIYNQRGVGNNSYGWYPTITYSKDSVSVDISTCLYYSNVLKYSPMKGGISDGENSILFAMSVVTVFIVVWSFLRHVVGRFRFRKG